MKYLFALEAGALTVGVLAIVINAALAFAWKLADTIRHRDTARLHAFTRDAAQSFTALTVLHTALHSFAFI